MTGFGEYPFGEEPFGGNKIPPGSAEPQPNYPDVLTPPVMATPRLFMTDMARSFHEPMELVNPYDITVVANEDASHARALDITVENPLAIRPLIDYVYLEEHLRDARGREMLVPLGHFLCDTTEVHFDGEAVTGRIVGYGSTLALTQTTLSGDYVLSPGDLITDALVDVIAMAGVPRRMIRVTPSTITAIEEKRWYEGETVRKVAADLAEMAAYYVPWPDGRGDMLSRGYDDYTGSQVAGVIGTEVGQMEILEPISDTRDHLRMVNRVTVRNIREPTESEPDLQPIIATATIKDYSHPLHPVRLQEARNASRPVILADPPIEDAEIETYAVAMEKAKNILAQRSSWYQVTKITQVLDAHPDLHQSVVLDVRHGLNPLYEGRWLRRAWTFEQRGERAYLKSELNRYVSVE